MKSTVPKFLALLLLVVLSASIAGAAGNGDRPHPRADRPLRREINAYFQATVLPVLRQQRRKLEPQLSAADRAQLATYRAQLRDLKARGQALRRSRRAAGTAQGAGLTDAQKQQVHQLRTEARGIMLNVAQMARPYNAAITQLAQEVQPQKEQWTADIEVLVAKSSTPEQQQALANRGGQLRAQHGRRRFFRPAVFLLMDPSAPTTSPAESEAGRTSFYPNPAVAVSQLDYEVKKAGSVTVDLLGQDGNKLRTLVSEPNASRGAHTQPLDLHDLPAGAYFYKITTRSGTQTKRFVKE